MSIYELPVAILQGIVLWAGIKHAELWLQVNNSHYYMQGIDYASVQSEPLSLLTLNSDARFT